MMVKLDGLVQKVDFFVMVYLDGITGEYATPAGYFVDEAEAEEFDKEFPYKEKLKLPGQIF